MKYRRLGKTGRMVSAIGFGAWAIGGDWGTVDDGTGLRALHAAADAGVTLFDTAESPPKSVRFSLCASRRAPSSVTSPSCVRGRASRPNS